MALKLYLCEWGDPEFCEDETICLFHFSEDQAYRECQDHFDAWRQLVVREQKDDKRLRNFPPDEPVFYPKSTGQKSEPLSVVLERLREQWAQEAMLREEAKFQMSFAELAV